jgi:hypothetical protein
MAALSVRVSEDPARPLGHAIVTLGGLPRGLETFEFALSRHGFRGQSSGARTAGRAQNAGLQPEEAWFSGELLKFVDPSRSGFSTGEHALSIGGARPGLDREPLTATFRLAAATGTRRGQRQRRAQSGRRHPGQSSACATPRTGHPATAIAADWNCGLENPRHANSRYRRAGTGGRQRSDARVATAVATAPPAGAVRFGGRLGSSTTAAKSIAWHRAALKQ